MNSETVGFMLRKDVLCMLNQEWEPKVPSAKIMREQFLCFSHRISGSVKLAGGYIDIKDSLQPNNKKRKRLQNLITAT